MRLLVMVFALTVSCAAAGLAAESCPPGSTPAAVGAGATATCPPAVTMAGDEMLDACIANAFSLTNQQITTFRSQGLTNADIAIASMIARQTNRPISTVVNDFQASNRNWNTVATNYNVSLAEMGITPSMIATNNEAFNQSFIAQYYGVPMTDVQAARNRGLSWGEITMIANASARTGQSFQQIATLRNQGVSWNDVATRYNIASADLMTPCPSRATPTFARTPTCPGIGAGPVCTRPVLPVVYDKFGNVLLTYDEAIRYYSQGNDWVNVAIATNLARETGYPISQALMDLRSGRTYEMVAMDYGVAPNVALNVANYPFPRRSIYGPGMEQRNLGRIERYQVASVPPGSYPYGTYGMPGAGPNMTCPNPAHPSPACPPTCPSYSTYN